MIQILEQTPLRLVMSGPPDLRILPHLVFPGILVLVTLVMIALTRMAGHKVRVGMVAGLLGAALVLGYISFQSYGTYRVLTLSRSEGKLHAEMKRDSKTLDTHDESLSQVRYATVQKNKGERLVLMLKSDQMLAPFGPDFTGTTGLETARDALNGFLGTTPPGGQ